MAGNVILYVGILIIGALAIGVLVVLVLNRQKQLRTTALRQAAEILGLNFFENSDNQVRLDYGHFGLFKKGRSGRLSNYAMGQYRDRSLSFFDYQYVTGGGNSSRVWKQTVLAFELEKSRLPAFVLRPRQWQDKFNPAARKSIKPDDAAFNQSFYLSGSDELQVKAFFRDSIVLFFNSHPGWTLEGQENHLLVYRSSRLVRPENLTDFLQDGIEIAGLFKPHR